MTNWLKRYATLFIFCVLFFFALHRIIAPRPGIFETITSYITYPVLLLHSYTVQPIKNFFTDRATNQELKKQLNVLQEQLTHAQAERIALQGQVDFAKDTKEIRDFAKRYTIQSVQLAQVLAKQLNKQQQTYIVNAGSRDGIIQDMVAVYKNCLIGRVSVVYPTYCKVQLITDKSCKVAAYCAQTKAKGIHEGTNHSDRTYLNFVSHLKKIKEGDTVLSSGTGLVFPRGFALGTITEKKQDGLYYNIAVKPLADLQQIEYVYLVNK